MLKGRDTLKVLSDQSSMTLEEEPLFSKSTSETLTDTSIELNISLLLKEPTQDNIFSVEEKQPFLSAMFSQSIELLRVPSFAILNLQSEIRDHTLDALAPMQPLLGILKMDPGLESDFLLVQERLFPEAAELLLELSQAEEETKSLSWRLVSFGTNLRDSERDSLKLQVWEWTLWTILTVVVTTSIWVSQALSIALPLPVKKSVSLPPEEPVSSEVLKQSRMSQRKSDLLLFVIGCPKIEKINYKTKSRFNQFAWG